MSRFIFFACLMSSPLAYADQAYFQRGSGTTGHVFDDQTSFNFDYFFWDGRYGALDNSSPFLPVTIQPSVFINEDVNGVGTGVYFDVNWGGSTGSMPTDSVLVVFYYVSNGSSHIMGLPGGSSILDGDYRVKLISQRPQGGPVLLTTVLGEANPDVPGLSFSEVRPGYEQMADPFPPSNFLIRAQLHYDGAGIVHRGDRLARFTITGEFVPEPSTFAMMLLGVVLFAQRARRPDGRCHATHTATARESSLNISSSPACC